MVKRQGVSRQYVLRILLSRHKDYTAGRVTNIRILTVYPEDLLTKAYTHLNFAFAFVDPDSFEIAPMSSGDTALYSRFTALKTYNPGLETWVSVLHNFILISADTWHSKRSPSAGGP